MPGYVSFLEDASQEFLSSFQAYRSVSTEVAERRSPLVLAQCIRGLYISFEKAIKHALNELDPYLLIQKPDAPLLLSLRKDLRARPVPSVFCSRQPFESPGMIQSWKIARALLQPAVDENTLTDFERGLGRLADLRNRAQHGEFYDDIPEVLGLVEQLLARVRVIFHAVCPQFLQQLYQRNSQLESLLRGIENRIDAAWQVLLDYLVNHGAIVTAARVNTLQDSPNGPLTVFFGDSSAVLGTGLTANIKVPIADAEGLFGTWLTSAEASARHVARTLERMRREGQERPSGSLSPLLASLFGKTESSTRMPVEPLDTGRLHIKAGAGWLSLQLAQLSPPFLTLSVLFDDWIFAFESPNVVEGLVTGLLRTSVSTTGVVPAAVSVKGTIQLVNEWGMDPDPAIPQYPNGATWRDLEASLQLTAP